MFTDKKGRKGEGDIIFLLPMNIKNATVHNTNVDHINIYHHYAIITAILKNSFGQWDVRIMALVFNSMVKWLTEHVILEQYHTLNCNLKSKDKIASFNGIIFYWYNNRFTSEQNNAQFWSTFYAKLNIDEGGDIHVYLHLYINS